MTLGRLQLDLIELAAMADSAEKDEDNAVPALYANKLKRTIFQINPDGNPFATMTVSAGIRNLSRY